MSSIQERLQLKRVPLDTWNIREQLCLASAVVRSGDQNWMSVSRALKTVGEPNKPADWYSQKSCAAQYGVLLEHVETPKRKKRNSEGAVETPQESILKKLTQERMVEIQKNLAEMNQQYEQIVNEINELRNPVTNDERVREMWSGIEAAKRTREREAARRAAWLREREERRARAERAWRPPQTPPTPTNTPSPSAAPPSSPLLTSLLKSSPVVTTPQHISHPANVVDTMSPSVNAPTLSSLLERAGGGVVSVGAGVGAVGLGAGSMGAGVGAGGAAVGTVAAAVGAMGGGVSAVAAGAQSASAAIEHIKSQLVQIEQQLKANTSQPTVDIDDIEIKAEDVYAFSDIDLVIPPVATIHKANSRTTEKQHKKEETGLAPEEVVEKVTQDVKEETTETEQIKEIPNDDDTTKEVVEKEVPQLTEPPKPVAEPETEVKIAFPEVKFPTMEIKVITSDEKEKVKEEVKEPKTPQVEVETVANVANEVQEIIEEAPEPTPIEEEERPTSEPPQVTETEVKQPEVNEELELVVQEQGPDPETIPLPPDSPAKVEETVEEVQPQPLPQEDTPLQEENQVEKETTNEDAEPPQPVPELAEEGLKSEEDIKKEEDAEDSLPLKEIMTKETIAPETEADVKLESIAETEEVHTETDDDTPMELSREEEKDGKKKRDYSRKKKPDSRTCSGSESAPESPGGCEAERQHRLWKRSVMLVYSRLCAHKYASVFLRPISDDEAPGYSAVVKRPMDLSHIKRNIETGAIRTTAEFQRDVLLMLSNALLYNSSEHSVYQMAKDMHEEAACQLGMLLAAQAHAGLAAPAATRKRRRQHAPHHHKRQHLSLV